MAKMSCCCHVSKNISGVYVFGNTTVSTVYMQTLHLCSLNTMNFQTAPLQVIKEAICHRHAPLSTDFCQNQGSVLFSFLHL